MSGAQGMQKASALEELDAFWRAANYLSVGQIYLLDNPLLREPLRDEHVKPRLLGHFGTVPGLNLIWAHMNRAIRARDLDAITITGPGHGGPGVVACAYLEGTYSERYSDITLDEAGLKKLFRQFSFPGGIPSHAAPETPGSIHEGGELGYSLAHAYGAAFDNPKLVVCCVGRRRRGRDRAACRELALEQVPRSRERRRRPAGAAPERLQDREPDHPGADPRARARLAARGLRPPPDPRHRRLRRRGPTGRPRALRRRPGRGARRNRRVQSGSRWEVADDHPADAEGLDRAQGGRRPAGREHVAGAPGPDRERARKPGAPAAARGVASLLPAGGALRRQRRTAARAAGAAAPWRAPHEREPARERRRAAS